MNKLNTTNGVFIDIVGDDTTIPAYDTFIAFEKNSAKVSKKKFTGLAKEYEFITSNNKKTFEQLAALEELILQERAITKLNDIKVSFVRDYIYVRTPFFRNSNTTKDIRVIVDRVEFCPGTADELMNDPAFVQKAKDKLLEAMRKEHAENLKKYEALKLVI
jgi:ERCC4-related helicase